MEKLLNFWNIVNISFEIQDFQHNLEFLNILIIAIAFEIISKCNHADCTDWNLSRHGGIILALVCLSISLSIPVSPPVADLSGGSLTHWGRDKMHAISQKTFSKAFAWMKMYEYQLKFRWNLFLLWTQDDFWIFWIMNFSAFLIRVLLEAYNSTLLRILLVFILQDIN